MKKFSWKIRSFKAVPRRLNGRQKPDGVAARGADADWAPASPNDDIGSIKYAPSWYHGDRGAALTATVTAELADTDAPRPLIVRAVWRTVDGALRTADTACPTKTVYQFPEGNAQIIAAAEHVASGIAAGEQICLTCYVQSPYDYDVEISFFDSDGGTVAFKGYDRDAEPTWRRISVGPFAWPDGVASISVGVYAYGATPAAIHTPRLGHSATAEFETRYAALLSSADTLTSFATAAVAGDGTWLSDRGLTPTAVLHGPTATGTVKAMSGNITVPDDLSAATQCIVSTAAATLTLGDLDSGASCAVDIAATAGLTSVVIGGAASAGVGISLYRAVGYNDGESTHWLLYSIAGTPIFS